MKNGDSDRTAVSRTKSRTWLTMTIKDGQRHRYARSFSQGMILRSVLSVLFRPISMTHHENDTFLDERSRQNESLNIATRDPGSITASILRAGMRKCTANNVVTRQISRQRRIGGRNSPEN